MNYNSAAFKAAVDAATEALTQTWQGLTDEQKTAFTSQGPGIVPESAKSVLSGTAVGSSRATHRMLLSTGLCRYSRWQPSHGH